MNELNREQTVESSNPELISGNGAEAAPEAEANLKRYAHLVWRIHERRKTEAVDRKSHAR